MPVKNASLDFDGEYTFYSTQMQTPKGCKVLKNGNLYHVSCKSSVAKTTKVTKVVGQSVKFAGGIDDFYKTCKRLGKIKSQYNAEGIVVAEGFSQKLGVAKNLKTNFQVAFDGKYITVGTPVIMGSF